MRSETQTSKTIEGIGLLVGMILGAGIFALPYSFSKAGLLWGSVLFLFIFFISWVLHSLYAAIIYTTPGRHRITGYTRIHLGRRAEGVMFVFTLLAYYGSMLAYGVLGGIFLETLFGWNFIWGGVGFLVLGGFLFFLSLKLVGKINFYLALPLLLFILILSIMLLPNVSLENFKAPAIPDWFLPYGVLLFAFGGYAVLPDLHDVLGERAKALSKKIILWSLLLVAFFYLMFTLAVLGVTGQETAQDAISGLVSIAGKSAIIIGSLVGLLATFTSYIVFGADLKFIYRYDYRFPEILAWFVAFLPPLLLFTFGFHNLVKILSLVGSVGMGVFGVFILWISFRERERLSSFLGFMPRLWWLLPLGVLIILGALQDIL